MEKANNFYEIDLLQLLRALWHRAWAIILAALIGGAASFFYTTYYVAPQYTAEALLYVNKNSVSVGNASFSLSTADLSLAERLVSTYLVILTSRATLNEVIQQADLNYSYNQLKGMISASAVNNTEVFRITVTSTDPNEAEHIANTIVDILPDKIADIMDGSFVRVVDYAVVPTAKASPNITRQTAMGVFVGIIIACGIIVLLTISDTQIRNEDYLMETYQLPVLAVIPDLFNSSKNSYYNYYTTPKAEAKK